MADERVGLGAELARVRAAVAAALEDLRRIGRPDVSGQLEEALARLDRLLAADRAAMPARRRGPMDGAA
jgi:hypothetical protein